MTKSLVIVESPAKAQTISRFLGKDYKVVASYGHVRDLPSSADEIPAKYKSESWSTLAVDVDNGFNPIYVIPKVSKKRITELKKELKEADELILATDEDREGESISWHLLETLKPTIPVKRIAFHEITKEAIEAALASPRNVNQDLVRAQECRRVLDRLYGYSLSPLLWKKVRPKLSAGRVQSVAVRLVVEREEERKAFQVAKYWSIEAALRSNEIDFPASLISFDGKRPADGKDFDDKTGALKTDVIEKNNVFHILEEDAQRLAHDLHENLPWLAAGVEQKKIRQRPAPPFITSTLQQAASSILNMPPRITMQIAQRLYEGIDLGSGDREGLITYMRTDSFTLSEKALKECGSFISQNYGADYHFGPRRYVTKAKNAQEAHEAIRPTHISLTRTPEVLKPYLEKEEWALYRLIWNRTLASQMSDAELLKTAIDFKASLNGKTAVLRSNGSVVSFDGYLKIADVQQKDTELPPIQEGQRVGRGEEISLVKIEHKEHQTQPPSRYTEASLIQRLEEEGIGRPSTYAPTITTIQQRGYVQRIGKALAPTFLAVAVNSMLRKHFTEYVDLSFTARMEDALDDISNGRQDSTDFLSAFYRGNGKFGHGLIPQIETEFPKIEYPTIPLGCDPESGDPVMVRIGKTSPYIQKGNGGNDNTAPVPNTINFEEMTLEKALALLEHKAKFNEAIGKHPDTGENIYAQIGPYGPYVQLGEVTEDNKKPKRASLPKGLPLEDITLETAVRLLSLPRELGVHPDNGEMITASIGRFGPYVKCGNDFRSLGKDDDVYTVELARALELLAQPKRSRRQTKTVLKKLGEHPESKKPIELCDGRYGPFVSDGEVNASIPKTTDPESVTLEQAVELIENAPKKKRSTRKKTTAKSAAKKTTTKKKSAAKKTTAKKSTTKKSTRKKASSTEESALDETEATEAKTTTKKTVKRKTPKQ
ncbi:MAG: type I DNA topoisomerase [Candidatus Omnitrophica bacterium]|nr:type I DNA topoisomerase [Candidatus Omnitrophota bacterium]